MVICPFTSSFVDGEAVPIPTLSVLSSTNNVPESKFTSAAPNVAPLIVGVVKVIKEHYPDKTDQSGRFVAVTVKFLKKLEQPVSLAEIKKYKELSHLSLIKQSRLSVMSIDSKNWKILNKMGKI